jgi:hypothetical protein
MNRCEDYFLDSENNISERVIDEIYLKNIFIKSAAQTKSPGSSTCSILHLDRQFLYSVTIGDSCYMIRRAVTLIQHALPSW